MATVQMKTRILPGGRIEVQSPGLPEGREVTLRISVDDEPPKRRIEDILANDPGGKLFKSSEEVDQFVKEERDSWEE